MEEEWFVQVQGKDYGPVDLDTLREWKEEGRLLPANPVRKSEETTWSTASQIPGLFGPIAEPPELPPIGPVRRRSFGEIMAETFHVYRRGFSQFMLLSLLVAVPSLAFRISVAFVNYREGEVLPPTARIASVVAVLAFAAVLVAWPIFVGGLQFATADLAAGSSVRFGDLLRRTINFWPRIAKLSLFVYGNYILWTLLPLLVILSFAGTPNILSLLLALVALVFQVYMAGRLFINFMFWQQSCTIGQLDGVDALKESRELARGRTEAPRLQRPLYRGAIIASLFLVVLLLFSAAVQLPFVMVRLQGVTTVEEVYALMQKMVEATAPDAMMLAVFVLSAVVHALLRPLLGIAFVLLYFDAKGKE